jgi:hypothetical protein
MLTYADVCWPLVEQQNDDSDEDKVQHTSAYVSIRQHTSAYVSIRQHTSAYVSGAHARYTSMLPTKRVCYVGGGRDNRGADALGPHACVCVYIYEGGGGDNRGPDALGPHACVCVCIYT